MPSTVEKWVTANKKKTIFILLVLITLLIGIVLGSGCASKLDNAGGSLLDGTRFQPQQSDGQSDGNNRRDDQRTIGDGGGSDIMGVAKQDGVDAVRDRRVSNGGGGVHTATTESGGGTVGNRSVGSNDSLVSESVRRQDVSPGQPGGGDRSGLVYSSTDIQAVQQNEKGRRQGSDATDRDNNGEVPSGIERQELGGGTSDALGGVDGTETNGSSEVREAPSMGSAGIPFATGKYFWPLSITCLILIAVCVKYLFCSRSRMIDAYDPYAEAHRSVANGRARRQSGVLPGGG